MNKVEGLDLLKIVIEKSLYHQDYTRVTDLADKYYKMKTGDKINDLLDRIITRETTEEKAQRDAISKSVIPSVLNSTQLPFQKCLRTEPLLREIKYEGTDKSLELDEFIGKFWGEDSLEDYLEFSEIEYNYIDPNAFLITEFGDFDPNREKASPYPFVATSKEAIMFEYKNEILQFLIVKLPIKFIENDIEKDGFKFTMYLGPDTIQLSEVAASSDAIEINNLFYKYQEFTPKALKVPARRFGFIRDSETQNRTFVSVFHNVLLLLEKLMKTDSELDLTTAMTAFPQRFAYVDKCGNKDCKDGKLLDGHTVCPDCHGTGQQPLHGGVKDVITLTLPRDPSQMIDLERMLVYKSPPVELLIFNKDYVNDLSILVHTMMFHNDMATQSDTAINVTATEKNYDYDNLNDTLSPFARNHANIWKFVVGDIATFTDLSEGLTLQYKMPKDFKFKGLLALMTELKAAKDAGAGTSTISAIEKDINKILYSDRPSDLRKIDIKSSMNPFRGYAEANVRLLISQGLTTEYYATLYANIEIIFNQLELEDPGIYDLNPSVINDKVREKALEIIAEIKKTDEEAMKAEAQLNPFQNVNQN